MSGSDRQFMPLEQPQIASVKLAGETALPEPAGIWRTLFKKELAALHLQKRTKNPGDGPVLFRYGPLVEVGENLALAEKQAILETLEKGWIRVSDKGTWVNDWTLEQIDLAMQACNGALTLMEAKLVKLDGHAHDHGNTEQAEAMHSYIAQHLHEIEDAIVESVMPRLLDGKELLLQHITVEDTEGGRS